MLHTHRRAPRGSEPRFYPDRVLGKSQKRLDSKRMADITRDAGPAAKLQDYKVISLVGAAHFMSHVYILMLPPLFIYARTEYGVTFEQLAYAMAAFGIC